MISWSESILSFISPTDSEGVIGLGCDEDKCRDKSSLCSGVDFWGRKRGKRVIYMQTFFYKGDRTIVPSGTTIWNVIADFIGELPNHENNVGDPTVGMG